MRVLLSPDKVNLASFGNVVPHLHWHVIPRWRDDRHFPNPIWGASVREAVRRPAVESVVLHAAFLRSLAEEQGGT